LIGDKLIDVLNALILGKASYRTMTGNVIVAVLFNIVGMVLAAMGLITPMLAIGVMIISIFAILINTLRIKTIKMETIQAISSKSLNQVNFKVTNMVCEGCAEKITNAVNELPGVKQVKPKVIQKQVAISYEPDKVNEKQIKEVIVKSGFNAIEV